MWHFELYDKEQRFLADITKFCTNRKVVLKRNDFEEVSFQLDLRKFEEFATSLGYSAYNMLLPYSSDIKVRRGDRYMCGVEVVKVDWALTKREATLKVDCTGYLNLFKDRYVTKEYTQEYETDIAWDLIDTTQTKTNGDCGITRGIQQVQLQPRDRGYERKDVKTAIQQLTDLETAKFDFKFTHDKQFESYEQIGSTRPELPLEYPGNITSISGSRDGSGIFNEIIGLGSGFGVEQIQSIQSDLASQVDHRLREFIALYSSIENQPELVENIYTELIQRRTIIDIPRIKINGTNFDLGIAEVGDIVPVKIRGFSYLQNFDDYFRIEQLHINLDENDSEDIDVVVDVVNY